jgi:hypothetical protein
MPLNQMNYLDTRKKRILALVIPLLVLLALDKIHRGLGRAVLQFGFISFITYCFVCSDKKWARDILNRPKKWWMD